MNGKVGGIKNALGGKRGRVYVRDAVQSPFLIVLSSCLFQPKTYVVP